MCSKLLSILSAVSLTAVPMLSAAEMPRGVEPIRITPQMLQQAVVQTQKVAPYRFGKAVETQNNFLAPTRSIEHIPNACSQHSGSLCFDYRTGQAVYKPTRTLLPPISGMTPHNLSLRRDKIVAQYTFK